MDPVVDQGFQAGFLNKKEKAGLIPVKPGEARAYGMPKAHKEVLEFAILFRLAVNIHKAGSINSVMQSDVNI